MGSYRKVGKKYLPPYVAEFQFQYNNRLNPDLFRKGGQRLLNSPTSRTFAILLAMGALVFVGGPALVHASYCQPAQHQVAPKAPEQAQRKEKSAQHAKEIGSQGKQENTAAEQAGIQRNDEYGTWYCDYKISDIGIVFLTYCLVVVGAIAIRSAERLTESLERPWFFITEISPSGIFLAPPILEVEITNYGKVAGRMISVKGGVKAAIKGIDIGPDQISLKERTLEQVRDTIPPNYPYTVPLDLAPYKDANAPAMIQIGDANFVARVVFSYSGLGGAGHETAFCVRYDAASKCFRRFGGKKYNYGT